MNQSNVTFVDLPNEILFYILNKLENVDVLYSLFGIHNQRIENIIKNEIYSNSLDFTSIIHNDKIFDRFCNFILSQINFNVKYLIIEPISIEPIFLNFDYPNLTQLKINNFQRHNSLNYLSDKSLIGQKLKQKITKLELVNSDYVRCLGLCEEYTITVYASILNYFQKIEHFEVIETRMVGYPELSIHCLPSTTFSSSTLTYLSIHVLRLNDCLCLLDGRLKQLKTFIVKICLMEIDTPIVQNSDELPNLKYFSLIFYGLINQYDNIILSLVRRMLYLEKLTLYLRYDCQHSFIDPISIINEYSMNLSRLNSFKFYISTKNKKNDLVKYLSTNNSFKQNLININCKQLSNIVCFDHETATYHQFTLPFEFDKLMDIGNTFANLILKNVTELWLYDLVPFKHEFFLRVAKSFPLLKWLSINDGTLLPLNEIKSSNNTQSYEIVEYPHLMSLAIMTLGTYYIEQFLNETKTRLPRLCKLRLLRYEDLRIVTEDFTREETRHNCINIKRLITLIGIVGSKEYYDYFPSLS